MGVDVVADEASARPTLGGVARAWGRIGVLGFGGPPAHIALLRDLCVRDRRWLEARAFEDAVAVVNLLPGPASTQLAILCAHRVRGAAGAVIGGLCFVVPGLVAIIALAGAFLADDPPTWLRGAGAGASAAVAAVALRAGLDLLGPSWARAAGRRTVVATYAAAGAVSAATVGPWVVVGLLACGAVELARRHAQRPGPAALEPGPLAVLAAAVAGTGGLVALCWTAFKVGALSYGGGFVIIPLMQADAVEANGWMTDADFLEAVALGQVTPGPVVHTVAVVGYAAAGVGGALLASVVAFGPSFAVVLAGRGRLDAMLAGPRVRAFVDGAAPAALGAILGSAVPLALALDVAWQAAVLAAATFALLGLRRGVVATLLAAGTAGAILALVGAELPAA